MSKTKSNKKKISPSILCDSKSEINPQDSAINVIDLPSTSHSTETSTKAIVKVESACLEGTPNFSSIKEVPTDVSCHYMKNSILDEVLNEKKAALLQSPAIMKFLREEQLKLLNQNKEEK